MSKATNDSLAGLHALVAEVLTNKLESEAVTAAELANAIKFLKDNGITADAPRGSPLGKLKEAMEQSPFADEDAEIERLSSAFAGPTAGRA